MVPHCFSNTNCIKLHPTRTSSPDTVLPATTIILQFMNFDDLTLTHNHCFSSLNRDILELSSSFRRDVLLSLPQTLVTALLSNWFLPHSIPISPSSEALSTMLMCLHQNSRWQFLCCLVNHETRHGPSCLSLSMPSSSYTSGGQTLARGPYAAH